MSPLAGHVHVPALQDKARWGEREGDLPLAPCHMRQHPPVPGNNRQHAATSGDAFARLSPRS
jgi:hypothetical protein